ncbi:hypothetical protein [Acetobacter sp.]|uniref:hypothetical protein n=1 Tax=Acetobacter sp. TaxID=440 RepID=UPI0039E7455F
MSDIQAPPHLAQHVMKEIVARSFRFSRPNSSAYWFNLMWIPGKLILTGDACDMTLTHFQACSSFDAAIKWASESEMDYLLRKSGERQQYDADVTLKDILRWANAPVIEALNGTVATKYVSHEENGRKKHRAERTHIGDGYRQLCQDYRRAVAAGTQDDFPEDLEATDPRRIALRLDRDSTKSFWDKDYGDSLWARDRDPRDFYNFDPCWENWMVLWKDTLGRNWTPGAEIDSPRIVATRAGRKDVEFALEEALADLDDAGLTCFWHDQVEPAYGWTGSQRYQIEAIQFACRQIIAAGLVDMSVQVQ